MLRSWAFWRECLQILCWTYFKPYTLQNYVNSLHPQLSAFGNAWVLRAEFADNPRLRRYAEQSWWLTILVPIAAILLVAPIYSTFAAEEFDFLTSGLFILGWSIGLFFARGGNKKSSNYFTVLLYIVSGIIFLFTISSNFFSIPEAITQRIASFNLVQLIIFWLPVAFGVTVGVAGGVAGGVAVGVASILGVLRVYFWLPELLWMVVLSGSVRFGQAPAALRYLPPRFDELIRLPLPFMSDLIVEAHADDPAAARETIAYLTNFTNQQATAARATTGITLDILNRCESEQNIVATLDELDWLPSPPPAQLSTWLPEFLDVARGVRTAREATSAYRHRELLNPPLAKLHNLQTNLAYEGNARLATSVGPIAARWRGILETAQRTLDQAAKAAREIPQAYIAGPALDPETAKTRFKGRDDLFRELETLIFSDQPPVLVLHGGRRTGKTSSLKYLPERVGADIIALLVDMQGLAEAVTLPGFAKSLVTAMRDAARRDYRLSLPDPDFTQLERDPFPALSDWFRSLETQFRSKRCLLCLDEFERLDELIQATNSRAPLNFLRSTLQHRRQWILLFSGARTIDELEPYWMDYLINTRALRLTYLAEAEARELIVNPVPDFPKIYTDDAIDEIIRLTRCQPFLVQLLCTEIVEHLNRRKQMQASVADVYACIDLALEHGGFYFRELWGQLNEREQSLLLNLHAGEAPQDRLSLKRLIDKEILRKHNDRYCFQVPLVEIFVDQQKL